MKPNYYNLLSHIVESGIEAGWSWAHKHVERPSAQSIKSAIEDHIMTQLSEYFDFETK